MNHFIQIYLPSRLPSLIVISFQVLSLAFAKQTLMMLVNIAMEIIYFRNFAINKNRLAEGIFEKKIFQVV